MESPPPPPPQGKLRPGTRLKLLGQYPESLGSRKPLGKGQEKNCRIQATLFLVSPRPAATLGKGLPPTLKTQAVSHSPHLLLAKSPSRGLKAQTGPEQQVLSGLPASQVLLLPAVSNSRSLLAQVTTSQLLVTDKAAHSRPTGSG